MSHETYYIAGQRAEQKKHLCEGVFFFFFFARRAPQRFEILGGSCDLLVVFGAYVTLARGASSKFRA